MSEKTVRKLQRISFRVANIGLKFISLFPKANQVTSALLGGVESITSLTNAKRAYSKKQKLQCLEQVGRGVLSATTTGLLLFGGPLGILGVHGIGLISDIPALFNHLLHLRCKKSLDSLAHLFTQMVFIASLIYMTPELIVASLLLQMLKELKISYGEYKQGNYPEMLANLILVGIRGMGGKEQFFKVKRDWLGQKITQKEWQEFVDAAQKHQERNTKDRFDAEGYFRSKNLSSRITKIDGSKQSLEDIFFKQTRFNACKFDDARFDRSKFTQVSFFETSFKEARCVRAVFENVLFDRCEMDGLNNYLATFQDVDFLRSSLKKAYFNDSHIEKIKIKESALEAVSFLHASVKNSQIEDCDLTNAILADAKKGFGFKKCSEHKFTKPVAALTWDFEEQKYYATLMKEGLESSGAIVMPFQISPSDVSVSGLTKEIELKAMILNQELSSSDIYRAKAFVSGYEFEENMEKLSERAEKISSYAHAIFLSGGDDVEPCLYQKELPSGVEDFRRSLLELFVLKKLMEKEKPLFATCRGSQITNVFLGGTLKTVGWQTGVKAFEWVGDEKEINRFQQMLDSEDLWGYSCHHQAMDSIAPSLNVVAKDGQIPKLVVGSSEQPIVLTQFHPEFYVTIPDVKKDLEELHKKIEKMKGPKALYWKLQIEIAKFVLKKLENHHLFYKDFLQKISLEKISV